MDVLLVNPENSRGKTLFRENNTYEPVELEQIGGYFNAHNITWDIWDGQVEKEPFVQRLANSKPSVVYIQGKVFQEKFMLEYASCAHDLGCTVIVGGKYSQGYPERFYKPFVDIILTTGNLSIITTAVKNDASLYRPSKEDNYSFLPDRQYFIEKSALYQIYGHQNCARVFAFGPDGLKKTATALADEILSLKVTDIFIDSDFLDDKKYVEEFIEVMNDKGILRRLILRGNSRFTAQHPGTMKALYDIGLCMVISEFSTAEDISAKSVKGKKIQTVDEQSAEILKALGINVVGKFTVKLTDRPEDFSRILKFVKRNKIKRFSVEIFQPPYTRELFLNKAYRANIITTDPAAWDKYHITMNPTNMTVKEFYFNYYELMVKLSIRRFFEG